MDRINFLLVSKSGKVIQRCSELCRAFEYTFSRVNDVQSIKVHHDFILLAAENNESEMEVLERACRIKRKYPDAFLLVSAAPKLAKVLSSSLQRLGADCVFLDSDLFTPSKLEFLASQKIKTTDSVVKANC